MKKLMIGIITLGALMLMASTADARDTRYLLPINTALNSAKGQVNNSVKLYFGNQAHPQVLQNFGSYVSNPKTNSFGKSDRRACNWVFISAVKALQTRAQKMGANAVINIVSYHSKNVMSSSNQFECHAGAVVAGVALKGDFVKISG